MFVTFQLQQGCGRINLASLSIGFVIYWSVNINNNADLTIQLTICCFLILTGT